MSELFLHNLAVTLFYVVTWPVAFTLFAGFGLNWIEQQYPVRGSVTAFGVLAGVLLLAAGITGSVSGVVWDIR